MKKLEVVLSEIKLILCSIVNTLFAIAIGSMLGVLVGVVYVSIYNIGIIPFVLSIIITIILIIDEYLKLKYKL